MTITEVSPSETEPEDGPVIPTRQEHPEVQGPFMSQEQDYEVVLLVRVKGFGTTTHQGQTAYTVAKELSDAMGQDSVRVFRTKHIVIHPDQDAYMEAEPVFYDPFVHDGHHEGHVLWWEKPPNTDGD